MRLWFTVAVLLGLLLAWVAPADWSDRERSEAVVRVHTLSGVVQTQVGSPLEESGWTVISAWQGDTLRVDVRHPQASHEAVRVEVVRPGEAPELVPTIALSKGERVAERVAPRRSGLAIGLLGAVALLWVSEVVPLWVTSLAVPVVLAGGGALSTRAALQPFFDPVIALFFAAFALADATTQAGLDRRLATSLIRKVGDRPRLLFAVMMGLSAVMSMFMSNTASAALLVPLAVTLTRPLGDAGLPYRRALVLGIAYAATLGGVGSAVGTPANPLAMGFLAQAGHPITFGGWFVWGLPVVLLMLPVIGAWVWWRLGAERAAARVSVPDMQAGPMSTAERQVAAVFAVVLLGWLTDRWHGLHPGLVGMAGVVVLATRGLFDEAGLARIDWKALLTFGGGLCMGAALQATGSSDWLAVQLEGLAVLPSALGVAAVAACSLALTSVASNTASAAILIPLALPLAAVLGVDPRLMVMVVAIATSIDFALVVGTPPTMVAYSTKLFTATEVFRVGVALDLIGLFVLLAVVVPLWAALGLVTL